MRYFLCGAVLFSLGCGFSPGALSEPTTQSVIACRDCIASLTMAASRAALIPADHKNKERTQPGFYIFASTPACIGPCRTDETIAGGDLLSDPQEDLSSWGQRDRKGPQAIALPDQASFDISTPGMSTFWQDPGQEDQYWEIGGMAFSGAETDFRTLTAGIKWVLPLK